MIRINLLPHREAKRKQKQAAFVAMLAAGGVAGAAVVVLVGAWNASRISVQNERNLVLKQASAELDKKIGQIKTLKEEIEALKARQQAVEDLQSDRNQPVYVLDELVRQTPEGVYLKSFRQDGQRVTLNGYAQSQERVAELLRNVSGSSPWLERPNLTEVRVSTLGQGKATARRVVEFQMDVAIKRPREQEAQGDGKPDAKLAKAAGTP
ncbi:PilN domain-containing protein [Massilia sp. LC238]|uniref:PilN domain-containing protein n=1 Tax=Massilia sp. LC238 TaxID=1502852 RepID=UPI0004E3A966|nr:PilN domain-containing protein [Massilia sp. LC238]KFC73608.1 Type IV pilus assembly protein PilN [Massilia sp. LC238]